jgi:hypothetical protein
MIEIHLGFGQIFSSVEVCQHNLLMANGQVDEFGEEF